MSGFAALTPGANVLKDVDAIGAWSSGVLYIDELWVTPEYRNNGIANVLCERANALLRETQSDRIRLYTDNPIAQRVYEKCGWRVTNECVFIESCSKKIAITYGGLR